MPLNNSNILDSTGKVPMNMLHADENNGIPILDASGNILIQGSYLKLKKNTSNNIIVKERTSDETCMYINQVSANNYDMYIVKSGNQKVIHTGNVNAVNGVAGLDSTGKVPIANLPIGQNNGIAGLSSTGALTFPSSLMIMSNGGLNSDLYIRNYNEDALKINRVSTNNYIGYVKKDGVWKQVLCDGDVVPGTLGSNLYKTGTSIPDPSGYTDGDIFYHTPENKLYIRVSGSWVLTNTFSTPTLDSLSTDASYDDFEDAVQSVQTNKNLGTLLTEAGQNSNFQTAVQAVQTNKNLGTLLTEAGKNSNFDTAVNNAVSSTTINNAVTAATVNNLLYSSVAKIGSGSYTGDGVSGRAIAHGLGRTPKAVIILCTSNNQVYINLTGTGFVRIDSLNNIAVTAWTSTNFYLVPSGVNYSGGTFNWIALG
ncbi:hypothetical protein MSHOH_2539 [Methanosarcina horonobensis HB-1 = JCM 15518]|uniref:Uncharacterized protein n=1 Tax=Methanosarcina horonobensis HB-1 = JCM 15518 TaxID=1434110 RepID=A0A0E3SFK5_9EURY|nr:hypothetical protein [Methanosarcina horonobensis]AKB79022.1 hypothetical protein MSHOH_2539 [Methanosarcina horonobensis HB-1 = JCM 15518]